MSQLDQTKVRSLAAAMLREVAADLEAESPLRERLLTRKALAVKEFLEVMKGLFAQHGAGDFDLSAVLPEVSDRVALDKECHELNGDPEEHDPDSKYESYQDWILMWYCAQKL